MTRKQNASRVGTKKTIQLQEQNKRITKKSRLIGMLEAKGGATVEQMSSELGWKHHTTRAALTGLRRAGWDIALAKSGKGGAGSYSISKAVAGRASVSSKAAGASK